MIGVSIPNSTTLGKQRYAYPQTVAADVLSDLDAGATIIAFDGTPINHDAIVPGTPFSDYLYSHPNKTIQLRLRRSKGGEHEVALPPQPAKSIGVRFAVGPVLSLVEGGPAAQAGLKVGDVIRRVNDDESPDAYGLALALVGSKEKVSLTVERGEGSEAESIELEITPVTSPQTIPPTQSITGELAMNSVGFAYRPLPIVAGIVEPAAASEDDAGADNSEDANALQVGDQLEEIRFVLKEGEKPAWLENDRYEFAFEKLLKGWEFSPVAPLNTLRDTLQALPEGTVLKVHVTRPPDNNVISTTVVVTKDDRMMFERGLVLTARESIQQADSISEALALGVKEGNRRFNDVLRFLSMLPKGQIKLRHVGGPLAIAEIAKNEAEKGISKQLMFLTFLSMNLAILNFLPIPALDGGHMVFLIYEAVVGRRANEQLEFRLTVAGLLALLMLMVVVFANDLMRLL
jgi:regulator of sigma E protease